MNSDSCAKDDLAQMEMLDSIGNIFDDPLLFLCRAKVCPNVSAILGNSQIRGTAQSFPEFMIIAGTAFADDDNRSFCNW